MMKPATLLRYLLGWTLLFSGTLTALAQSPARPGSKSTTTTTTSTDRSRTVVVLGDSLTAGYGVDPSQAFPALLQQRITQAGWSFRIVNAGVSGDTTSGGLRRINWLLKRPVDVLLIALGGNDGLRGIPLATIQTNLQGIINRTKKRYPTAKIFVAGMQMPPNMGEAYTRPFRQIFIDVAKKNKATLIPFLLEGVGGKPEFNLPDLIHPNPEGHKRVAHNVWKTMKPVLEKIK